MKAPDRTIARNGWTLERRALQSQRIRQWRPWEQSTGPRTAQGKAKASRNAYAGGSRAALQQLAKSVNALLKQHRERLDDLTP